MNLRIARHTDDLEKTEAFYVYISGFGRLVDF